METISLARGIPAPECVPVEELAECARAAMLDDGATILSYGSAGGYAPLRRRIAEEHGVSQQRVVITNGSLQGFALLAQVLAAGGERVLVEAPTYDRPLRILGALGAEVAPVPCDEDGLDVDALEAELCRGRPPAFLYVIPTFQNPTGRTLSAERRAALAEAAAHAGLWLIEDDPYSALRLDGEPVDLLAAHAPERTLVIQTLSKVLSPGLRIGYLRAPAALKGPLAVAKQAADLHTSTVAQLAAERWLARNDLSTHIASLAAHYRPRRDALLSALEEHLPAGSTTTRPEGGLFIWVRLPAGFDAEAILPRAIANGVAFVPGNYFYAGEPDPRTLRVSFATATPAELHEGAARLGAAIAAA
jgi:DNA-binding transcriptional MocR family regulator